jgi:hypothetical protein
MSFREKTAWITAISIVLCFGVYYGAVFTGIVTPRGMASFHLGLACILALVIMQVGFNIIASMLNPKDARTPRDEREKMIQARSHTFGYYTLMAATVSLFIPTHTRGVGMIDIVNYAVLGVVISALVVAIAQIVMFRRGS